MKIRVKFCLLLILFNIFKKSSTEMISGDVCDVEDAALSQWYTEIFQFVKTNRNSSLQLAELNGKLRSLEVKVEATHKQLEHQQQALRNMNEKIEQLQQKTNGDIVIQRRQDGSVEFFRSWADYKLGFGNSSGEFFIGLDRLHKLTNSRPYELLVVMEDWENDRRYAKYDQFVIGSEAEKYALKQLGTFSGSAGDSMKYELGQKFSTRDRDNDAHAGEHCAVRFTGAWWYKSCHASNLNGRYLMGKIGADERAQGVHWDPFKGHLYSLKFVEMTIRPN